MELTQVIAQNIQNLLDKHRVTATELSNMLQVSRQTMFNYLKASSTIDSVRLAQIADYFGVPLDSLYAQNGSCPTILFRSALHYEEAVDEVEEQISNYLSRYETLAKDVGKNICFLPEQYNLSVKYKGNVIDINFDSQYYFDSKLKLDNTLKREIWQIADSQREILGLENSGAIELIPALALRGINVIFLDLHTTDIFGLSICDERHGCFIFVNSNPALTYERQLFTIGHEYAHIVLHRPLFKMKLHRSRSTDSGKENLLDKMADCFAARLLCPPNRLQPYAAQFAAANDNLNVIISIAMPLKQELQISLQSFMMGLKTYGLISPEVVSEYFVLLIRTGTRCDEPMSFAENEVLKKRFYHERNEPILRMLRTKSARNQLFKVDIEFFLDCDEVYAKEVYYKLEEEKIAVRKMFDVIPDGNT